MLPLSGTSRRVHTHEPAFNRHKTSPDVNAAGLQDENRHGDFFTAVLKVQPQFLDDWRARAWSKFFCLSVYVTMYLNDHQRSAFYESLGLNTTQFNRHAVDDSCPRANMSSNAAPL